MSKIVNLYHKNTDNVGDLNSPASIYYNLNIRRDDLLNYSEYSDYDCVFGGGMVIKKISQLSILDSIKGKKIGWNEVPSAVQALFD